MLAVNGPAIQSSVTLPHLRTGPWGPRKPSCLPQLLENQANHEADASTSGPPTATYARTQFHLPDLPGAPSGNILYILGRVVGTLLIRIHILTY